jgi:hypothetical protein
MPKNETAQSETAGAAEVKPKKRRWWKFPRTWKEVRALGWKAILGFVLFYLIRDSILYLLLPYLAYKGIIGN